MRVLVTGAGGFVGRHLVPHLVAAGHEVTATSRVAAKPGPAPTLPMDDASPDAAWAAALRGMEAVVHAAGLAHRLREDPATADADHRRVNRDWTLRIARIARAEGVGRFLFVSTIGVHGNPAAASEGSAIAPANPYARAKAEAEAGLREAFADASLVMLRPPLVHGAGAPGNLGRLVRLADTGWPLPFGAVRNQRTLLAVEGLCRAVEAVLARWASGAVSGAYVLGDAAPVSTAGMVGAIRDGLGRPRRLVGVPPPLLALAMALAGRQAMAAQLLGDLVVEPHAFRRDFGWVPDRDTLAGLRAMAAGGR